MKQPLIQIYEIQEPREAEALIELGVDHIGSVLLNPEGWKVPAVRDVVRLVGQSSAKSTLIPLFPSADDILRALDYYSPAFVHFCELIPLAPRAQKQREELCTELIRIQQLVKKEFPPIGIIRSIPLPVPGSTEPEPAKEAILAIARRLAPYSDFFMTDTLRGSERGNGRPARCRVCRHHRGDLRLGSGRRPRRGRPDPRHPRRRDRAGKRL